MQIRPHHILCIGNFEGKGYSKEFTENMSRVISALESGEPFTLTAAADDICKACPYNTEGVCKDIGKVSRYDKAVKALLELEYGREYKYGDTAEKVKARVYSQNKLNEICGDCEWAEICTGKN